MTSFSSAVRLLCLGRCHGTWHEVWHGDWHWDWADHGSRKYEDEQRHEREVDEEHRLDQTDRQEEDRLQATLRLRLPRHALDVGRTGQAGTDTGTDRAAGQVDATADERASSLDCLVAYCHISFSPWFGDDRCAAALLTPAGAPQ